MIDVTVTREGSESFLVTVRVTEGASREPKESIMRSFDLMVIARYFPEYERTIR